MEKILLSFFSFSSMLLFSQADCVRPLIYSGKVSIKNFDINEIHVPSTAFLSDYVKFNDLRGFKIIKVNKDYFSQQSGTNLSSHFCGSLQEIINDFFKQKKSYPIKIIEKKKDHLGKYRILKFIIPVEKMIFKVTEDEKIEIIFPDIEL